MNLLPPEEKAQQRAPVDFKLGELVIPLGLLVAVGLVIAGTAMSQRMAIGSLKGSIEEVDAQSRVLAPQIERVNRLAQERAELDIRLGVIHRLQQGRTLGVRMMDEMARCVPDHMWITSATQDGPTLLNIEGVTFSNLVVSDFMSRLERSAMFAGVELEVAERTDVKDFDVVSFRLKCQVTADAPAN